ncbi:MAG: 1-acyl-sn-glycerol-3-phosphate acyltransferase, partial [Pseudomonadota bacterium]
MNLHKSASSTELAEPSTPWPEEKSEAVIFLVDASNNFDRQLLIQWIKETAPTNVEPVWVEIHGKSQTIHGQINEAIAAPMCSPEQIWLQPVRVTWLPQELSKDGKTSLFRKLLAIDDRRPGAVRRRWISKQAPHRIQKLAGQGARLSDVKVQFEQTWGAEGAAQTRLPSFILRQALIVLERAERALHGRRYKVAKVIHSDIITNPSFQRQLGEIAGARGVLLSEIEQEAISYLEEMAASQTPFTVDMMIGLQRLMYTSTHEREIGFIQEELDEVEKLINSRPVVFLVSHKSMLDTIALCCTLFDQDMPTPLTFGGINLNTPGIGSLARRSGVVFLRRSFQDNEVYKLTFRRYVDYLLEKRFSLMWALEGARSRTGKLLPPKYGMFNYVVESILRTKMFEVTFIPVSIVYDQITEVEDYAREQRGLDKKPEGAGWFVRFMMAKKPHGKISLRFGKPLTAADVTPLENVDATVSDDLRRNISHKLAFEAAVQMNEVTPVTATSLVTLALLATGSRAHTLASITHSVSDWMEVIRKRKLPTVGMDDLDTEDAVQKTLAELAANDIVKRYDEGLEPVYAIEEGQHFKAAYYRNTIIHFFFTNAFIELALLRAMSQVERREETLWEEIDKLRDLFKFEFYFRQREESRRIIRERLDMHIPEWQNLLRTGETSAQQVLSQIKPLVAHGVLSSFVESYYVFALTLSNAEGEPIKDKKK